MRAVNFLKYGDESVLGVREVAAPSVGADEVLVRVSVASLNPVDFKLRQGMLRWLRMPRLPAITGKDFAGTIEAIGRDVKGYAVGDRVFGSVDPMKGRGSCAEFVALSTDLIAKTPDGVSDEVAACLPVASGTALQALRDVCSLSAGQSVLITGASGAVGASGVQIAKHLGAKVTGVCSTSNVEYVRSIGADRVVDYKSSDWTTLDERFDVVFDAAASNTLAQASGRLSERGWYVNTVPRPGLFVAKAWTELWTKRRVRPFMLKTDAALLRSLAALAERAVLVPRIARRVGLDGVADAQRAMAQGTIAGKVCVEIR